MLTIAIGIGIVRIGSRQRRPDEVSVIRFVNVGDAVAIGIEQRVISIVVDGLDFASGDDLLGTVEADIVMEAS